MEASVAVLSAYAVRTPPSACLTVRVVSVERAVTLPAVSLTLRDLEESASKLARDLGRSPGTVS